MEGMRMPVRQDFQQGREIRLGFGVEDFLLGLGDVYVGDLLDFLEEGVEGIVEGLFEVGEEVFLSDEELDLVLDFLVDVCFAIWVPVPFWMARYWFQRVWMWWGLGSGRMKLKGLPLGLQRVRVMLFWEARAMASAEIEKPWVKMMMCVSFVDGMVFRVFPLLEMMNMFLFLQRRMFFR